MRIVKIFLGLVAVLVVLIGGFIVYLDPDFPLRGAVRDNWQPLGAPASASPPAPRENCATNSPYKRALFGDLHVHTALSYDARNIGTLARPSDAYRFARGEAIALTPTPDGEERLL